MREILERRLVVMAASICLVLKALEVVEEDWNLYLLFFWLLHWRHPLGRHIISRCHNLVVKSDDFQLVANVVWILRITHFMFFSVRCSAWVLFFKLRLHLFRSIGNGIRRDVMLHCYLWPDALFAVNVPIVAKLFITTTAIVHKEYAEFMAKALIVWFFLVL